MIYKQVSLAPLQVVGSRVWWSPLQTNISRYLAKYSKFQSLHVYLANHAFRLFWHHILLHITVCKTSRLKFSIAEISLLVHSSKSTTTTTKKLDSRGLDWTRLGRCEPSQITVWLDLTRTYWWVDALMEHSISARSIVQLLASSHF